jgi:hypothetical protein
MGPKSSTVERKLAAIAAASHGVVTRAEVLRAGITERELKRRVAKGTLVPVHRGVYRVGHAAPSLEARYMAAVKACGERSLLAGRAAAHLLGLLKRPPSMPEVLTATQRRPQGVVIHRVRRLDPRDATEWRGVPVTNAPRTLVDLAAVLDPPDIAVLRRAPLPLPETNQLADGYYVDCCWPEHRLTVELDSYRYHGTRHAWELDIDREREARARGDEFRRYTWRDVAEDPEPMLKDLRALLTRQLPLAA